MILFLTSPSKMRLTLKLCHACSRLGMRILPASDQTQTKLGKYIPAPSVARTIKNLKPNLVITDSPYFVPGIATLLARKVILYLRGDIWSKIAWDMAFTKSLKTKTMLAWRLASLRNSLHYVEAIFTVGKWLSNHIKEKIRSHVPIFHTYVGLERELHTSRPFDLKHPAIISLLGFDNYGKICGFPKLIQCAKKLEGVNFYVAGSGPYLELFRKHVPDNLELIGQISHDRVASFLSAGDLFVYPSGWDSEGRSLIEASIMEKPIIASKVCGIPEVVENGKTGLLCDLGKTDQWIDATRFLLDNPEVGEKLGTAAREYVSVKFDWGNIAKDFVRKLDKI